MSRLSVLIVCLANICRSPMPGEAILRHEATKRGIDIEVDSAGTGEYQIGAGPDPRTVSTCEKHNVPIDHSARRVEEADFSKFQYILAADEYNLHDLIARKPAEATAIVRLWGSYLNNKPIPDPYGGDITGFERCFEECTKFSNAFLDEVASKN